MIHRARRLRRLDLLLLATLLAGGCGGDPHEIRLTSEPPETQLARLRSRRGLSVEETRLLYGYFARLRLESVEGASENLAGRTVGQVIAQQRAWEMANMEAIAAGQREASKWRLQADRAIRTMDATLAVRALNWDDPTEATPGGTGSRAVIVRLELENLGRRTIVEAEGAVKFTDVYGRDLFDGPVEIRESLKPREIVERVFRIDCAPFMDQELTMRHVRLADTRAAWEPRKIRFENGGLMVVPDE